MGPSRASRRRRRSSLRRVLTSVATVAAIAVLAQVPLTSAQFTATTGSAANSFAAASSWCTAPGSLVGSIQNDTFIEEAAPTRNNFTDIHLDVRPRVNEVKRVLIRPQLPNIPPGCDLVSAVLTLDEHGYTSRTMHIHRIASAWNVSSVTWNNQPPITGTPVAALTTPTTWNVDIAPLIQALLDSGTNHGIMIRDANEGGGQANENRWHSIDDTEFPYITYTWA